MPAVSTPASIILYHPDMGTITQGAVVVGLIQNHNIVSRNTYQYIILVWDEIAYVNVYVLIIGTHCSFRMSLSLP